MLRNDQLEKKAGVFTIDEQLIKKVTKDAQDIINLLGDSKAISEEQMKRYIIALDYPYLTPDEIKKGFKKVVIDEKISVEEEKIALLAVTNRLLAYHQLQKTSHEIRQAVNSNFNKKILRCSGLSKSLNDILKDKIKESKVIAEATLHIFQTEFARTKNPNIAKEAAFVFCFKKLKDNSDQVKDLNLYEIYVKFVNMMGNYFYQISNEFVVKMHSLNQMVADLINSAYHEEIRNVFLILNDMNVRSDLIPNKMADILIEKIILNTDASISENAKWKINFLKGFVEAVDKKDNEALFMLLYINLISDEQLRIELEGNINHLLENFKFTVNSIQIDQSILHLSAIEDQIKQLVDFRIVNEVQDGSPKEFKAYGRFFLSSRQENSLETLSPSKKLVS